MLDPIGWPDVDRVHSYLSFLQKDDPYVTLYDSQISPYLEIFLAKKPPAPPTTLLPIDFPDPAASGGIRRLPLVIVPSIGDSIQVRKDSSRIESEKQKAAILAKKPTLQLLQIGWGLQNIRRN